MEETTNSSRGKCDEERESYIFNYIVFTAFFLPWNENELKRRILRSNEYIKKTYVHILIKYYIRSDIKQIFFQ